MGWSARSLCILFGTHTLGSLVGLGGRRWRVTSGGGLLVDGVGDTNAGAGTNNSEVGFILPGAIVDSAIMGDCAGLRCQEGAARFRLDVPVVAPPLAM
jgi:hypothetical protein